MPTFNRRDDFGWMAVLLHWLLFILIAGLIAGGKYSDSLGSAEKILILITSHKQIGVAVFVLMAFRLVWRIINTTPEALSNIWYLKIAAFTVHWLLYVLVLFQAAVGVYMSQLADREVSFLVWELPSFAGQGKALLEFISGAPAVHEFLFGEETSAVKRMRALHEWGGNILLAFIIIHVVGALMHHIVLVDNTLRRMFFGYVPPVYRAKDKEDGKADEKK